MNLPKMASLADFDPTVHPVTRRTLRQMFDVDQEMIKIAFFDADSTLRVSRSGNVSANTPRDVEILPFVPNRLKELSEEGFLIAIVSNQGGVPEHVSLETANSALQFTIDCINQFGANIDYYDFAEGNSRLETGEDSMRKPNTGMGNLAASIISLATGKEINWSESFMVGDSGWKKTDEEPDIGGPGQDFSNSDRLFAENLAKEHGGMKFHHPKDFFGWKEYGIRNFRNFTQVKQFYEDNSELALK